MAVTLNFIPTRAGTGSCNHFIIEATLTAPGITRVFTHRTTKAELMEEITDEDLAAAVRVLVRIEAAQKPNATLAQLGASIAAKIIDLTVL